MRGEGGCKINYCTGASHIQNTGLVTDIVQHQLNAQINILYRFK